MEIGISSQGQSRILWSYCRTQSYSTELQYVELQLLWHFLGSCLTKLSRESINAVLVVCLEQEGVSQDEAYMSTHGTCWVVIGIVCAIGQGRIKRQTICWCIERRGSVLVRESHCTIECKDYLKNIYKGVVYY